MKSSRFWKYSVFIIVFLGIGFIGVASYRHSSPTNEEPRINVAKYLALSKGCEELSKAQIKAYEEDTLVKSETFDKYKVAVYEGSLAMFNREISLGKAKEFPTRINEELDFTGINFAGKYSLVSVGMTGWGENYFLVDRTNGKAVPFPFQVMHLGIRKDSSLLVINPKDLVFSGLENLESTCMSTGNLDEYYVNLRPYYYVFDGTTFVQLGNAAKVNTFWEGVF